MARQGNLLAYVQAQQNEEMANILYHERMGRAAANSATQLRYGRAPVFPPGPVPVDYKTRPPQPAVAIAPPATPTSTPAPIPVHNSRSVHPGVVVAIVLVVLVILGALGNAAFKRIVHVSPARAGIHTASSVTWSQYPQYGDKIAFVEFRIDVTNTSGQERKVRYCARQYSDSRDACINFKAPPHSTTEVIEQRSVGVERNRDMLAGPLKRVVRIDGHYVTD
jgi:hypothetical protein